MVAKLRKVLDLFKKEIKWVILEAKIIEDLEFSVLKKDLESINKNLRMASRVERRVYKYKNQLIKAIENLHISYGQILELKKQVEIYSNILVNNLSNPLFGEKGEIYQLVKKGPIDWIQLKSKIDEIDENGIKPLLASLKYLKQELIELSEHAKLKEKYRKQDWFGGLSEKEKESRTEFEVFYHAYTLGSGKETILKGGHLSEELFPTGFYVAKHPDIAVEVLSYMGVDPARIWIMKVSIIKNIIPKLFKRGIYLFIPVERFEIANKEIDKGKIKFELH